MLIKHDYIFDTDIQVDNMNILSYSFKYWFFKTILQQIIV